MLTGNVLITGGAGFLARAIYTRARAEGWDCQFTAFSRDDTKHAALQRDFPEVQTVLGDVGQSSIDYLAALFRGHDYIIHAAASKHVDRGELHALDTIRTNVHGSQQVAMAAMAARVRGVVGISTDKACGPLNTYGASKMLMERLFQEMAQRAPETHFAVCRYGNVVGSTGSVVPRFRRLMQEGQPIRLTDPAMTRFWMSPSDAVDVILYTLLGTRAGDLVIPRCEAMGMGDLVDALYQLERVDPQVEVVGTRPGEKMHEALYGPEEALRGVNVAAVHVADPYLIVPPPGVEYRPAESSDEPAAYTSDHAPRIAPDRFLEAVEEAERLGASA